MQHNIDVVAWAIGQDEYLSTEMSRAPAEEVPKATAAKSAPAKNPINKELVILDDELPNADRKKQLASQIKEVKHRQLFI